MQFALIADFGKKTTILVLSHLRSSQFIAIGRHLIFPIDIQIDATPLLLNKYSQK
jgi:hypothetical protein